MHKLVSDDRTATIVHLPRRRLAPGWALGAPTRQVERRLAELCALLEEELQIAAPAHSPRRSPRSAWASAFLTHALTLGSASLALTFAVGSATLLALHFGFRSIQQPATVEALHGSPEPATA